MRFWSRLFRSAIEPDFVLMEGRRISPRGGYSLVGLASQISRPHSYRACLGGSEEGNLNLQSPPRTLQSPEKRVSE
ncbi:hypothetical protein TNCV_4221701 [Trichonephila clavipes]|nr:hypothetical protein TNCV_4221701 [Trichonephila clavipes]